MSWFRCRQGSVPAMHALLETAHEDPKHKPLEVIQLSCIYDWVSFFKDNHIINKNIKYYQVKVIP